MRAWSLKKASDEVPPPSLGKKTWPMVSRSPARCNGLERTAVSGFQRWLRASSSKGREGIDRLAVCRAVAGRDVVVLALDVEDNDRVGPVQQVRDDDAHTLAAAGWRRQHHRELARQRQELAAVPADQDARTPVTARQARAIDLGQIGEPGIAVQGATRSGGSDQAAWQQNQQADSRDADGELELLAELGIVGVQLPVVDDAGELGLLRVRLVQRQEQHAGQVDRRAGQRRIAKDHEDAGCDLAARGPGGERQGSDAAHFAAC